MTPTIINKFGRMAGWNSITVNLLGRDVEGITTLKYDDTVSIENVYGAGRYPIGYSEGNYEATASLTLYKEELNALVSSLPPNTRLQDIAEFDITVVYEMKDGTVKRDKLRNCKITNNGVDVAQSDGSIATELTLRCSHIDWGVAA